MQQTLSIKTNNSSVYVPEFQKLIESFQEEFLNCSDSEFENHARFCIKDVYEKLWQAFLDNYKKFKNLTKK